MTTLATAAQRMNYARDRPLLTPFYDYPAPEFFRRGVQYNRYHNLEKSKSKSIPSYWDAAMNYVYVQMNILQVNNMPPKKRSKQQNDNMPEMIGTKLSDVQLAEYDEWLTKNSKQFSKLYGETLLESIKIGVSWDAYNNCFICSFTPKDEDHENHGKCLLSRSQEWEDSVLLNVYKSRVIYGNGEWLPLNNNDQRG